MSGRVLIACVGNLLRGDDGFGVVVGQRLTAGPALPAGVDLVETGIGGISIVQQLMDGYEALIVVDAVDRGTPPGAIFVLEPRVPDPAGLSTEAWRDRFSDLHLTEPSRVFLLARAFGVLPERVLLVGCQPAECEELREGLTPAVEAAVALAARRVRELATELAAAGPDRAPDEAEGPSPRADLPRPLAESR